MSPETEPKSKSLLERLFPKKSTPDPLGQAWKIVQRELPGATLQVGYLHPKKEWHDPATQATLIDSVFLQGGTLHRFKYTLRDGNENWQFYPVTELTDFRPVAVTDNRHDLLYGGPYWYPLERETFAAVQLKAPPPVKLLGVTGKSAEALHLLAGQPHLPTAAIREALKLEAVDELLQRLQYAELISSTGHDQPLTWALTTQGEAVRQSPYTDPPAQENP